MTSCCFEGKQNYIDIEKHQTVRFAICNFSFYHKSWSELASRLHPHFKMKKFLKLHGRENCVLLWASSNEHMHGNRLRLTCISLINHALNGCCKYSEYTLMARVSAYDLHYAFNQECIYVQYVHIIYTNCH